MPPKPRIDYTSRDWASLGASLEAFIRARFPHWTGFEVANVGNVFKELVQYVGDGLHYYLDFWVNELFVDTATQRESLLALARLLGYEPEPRRSALVAVTFTLADGPRASDVVIPKGSRVWTEAGPEPLAFELQQDVLIRAGQASAVGVCKHCQTIRETFTITDPRPWLELPLSRTPFLPPGPTANHGRIRVRVGGIEWQRLDSLLDATMGQLAYEVRVDGEGRGWVMFGDGTNGAIPSGFVKVTYEVGGGAVGNVPIGAITRFDGVATDARGAWVAITVTNAEPGAGGADEEDLERIRRKIPRARRSERSVHLEDFEAHAELVPGVLRAKAMTAREDASIPEATVRVYIVPEGGGAPSATVLAQVEAMFRDVRPAMATVEVEVLGASYLTWSVDGAIRVKSGYDPDSVRQAAEQAVRERFSFEATDEAGQYVVDWGRPIYLSEIVAAIQAVEGVRSVRLASPSVDVVPSPSQIPALGTVTLAVVN